MLKTLSQDSYIHITPFMVTDLKLKGNELLVYASIFGFCIDHESGFYGSLEYLQTWTNSSKQGVLDALDSLLVKGLITKAKTGNRCFYKTTNVRTCDEIGLKTSKKDVKKVDSNSQESGPENVKKVDSNSQESGHNNKDIVNSDNKFKLNSPSPDSDTQNAESAPTDSTSSSSTPSNEVAELLDFVNEQTEINRQQAEENKELQEDNKNLREDNKNLSGDNKKLQEEVERLKKELAKKSKSSATSKYKKEDYTECAEIIKKNQELLLKNKRDISVVNYPVKTFNHLIKKCFDLYGVEDTKKGLINSVNFEWLINTTKYSLTALVADKTFPKCIANDFGSKYKPQPVKNPTTGSVNFDNQDYGEEVF